MRCQNSRENSKKRHVVMLVNNPCVNDSRVIKSAEAIAQTGRHVTVVCRQEGDLPIEEERSGVCYLRIAPVPHDWLRLRRRFPWLSRFLESKFIAANHAKRKDISLEEKDHELGNRFIVRSTRPVKRFIVRSTRSVKHFTIRYLKGLLRSMYWFVETDEFGTAAEPSIRNLFPDVIHAHDLSTLPLGGRIAKTLGVRLVYDSHELEMHRNANYPISVKWRRRYLETKYIRKADCVITVSESIADHLQEDYKIPRPSVVMNAPLFDEIALPQRDVRTDLGLDDETPLAVYVGSVTINRGIEYVIRALVYAPELHFATVGPRRPATEDAVVLLAEELGVRERVHFVDPVQPKEVVGYIRTAGVSVLPIQNVCLSYYYCMPNKLLESVFAGVPVVVANLLEMRRFVETHGCGVVIDETDPEDIARAIRAVTEDRVQYILSREGRNKLVESYGWSFQAARLVSLYDGLDRVDALVTVAAGGAV